MSDSSDLHKLLLLQPQTKGVIKSALLTQLWCTVSTFYNCHIKDLCISSECERWALQINFYLHFQDRKRTD